MKETKSQQHSPDFPWLVFQFIHRQGKGVLRGDTVEETKSTVKVVRTRVEHVLIYS